MANSGVALRRRDHELSRAETRLTLLQCYILEYVARGLSNRMIASLMRTSERNVKFHLTRIHEKLGDELFSNRTSLVAFAYESGFKPVRGFNAACPS